MKETCQLTEARLGAKRIPIGVLLALATLFPHHHAKGDVVLGTDNNFAVLAGSTITSTGATVITGGDVGLSPGSAITGFSAITLAAPYTTQVDNAVAIQAQKDLTTAYNTSVGLAPTETLTGQNLGGLTLTPGVYFFASSAQLTGKLTLNDEGNPNAQFVFQIGSTLTTASDSSVVMINGENSSSPNNVFWQVGSSATLGTGTDFEGNILAETSITENTSGTVDGRLLAENGAVTLDDNTNSVPLGSPVGTPDTGSSLLLLGGGMAVLLGFGCRFSSLA